MGCTKGLIFTNNLLIYSEPLRNKSRHFYLLALVSVGVNTYPNAVPFLSGLSTDELHSICCPDPKKYPQDMCPYIWKRFNACGYLTAHVEDYPYLNIFNYLKVGFLKDHVDFVVRPLMLKMYEWVSW